MLTDRVDGDVLRSASRLRVVGNCAVGYDNIDIQAARERGIVVVNTPNVLTDATADFAWALLLAAGRRVAEADRFVRAGHFAGWRLELMLGQELSGRTLGIVGLGRIGAAVARRGLGFGLHVLYTQRTRAALELERELAAEFVTFDELLGRSDFVSIHVPLSLETRHLFDDKALSRLKPSSILVNTSRGAVIDEAALAQALLERRIAGAGLDVFEREPEIHPALLALDNVVLAPHVASATEATRAKMARAVAQDILRVLRGEPPHQRVA
jgi:glyoxylate reductase